MKSGRDMRRNDTNAVGEAAKAEAARLLHERGYEIRDKDASREKNKSHDFIAAKNGTLTRVRVKCARAKRDLALGVPASVNRLQKGSFLIAFLPKDKDRECSIEQEDYEVWIVPADAVIEDALGAHAHYWGTDRQKYEANTVRIKDKVDRPGGRSRAGEVFQKWSSLYKNAWSQLP